LQNPGKLVGKDRLARGAQSVNPYPDRVGQSDLAYGVSDFV
jgi:hypothetical protein